VKFSIFIHRQSSQTSSIKSRACKRPVFQTETQVTRKYTELFLKAGGESEVTAPCFREGLKHSSVQAAHHRLAGIWEEWYL